MTTPTASHERIGEEMPMLWNLRHIVRPLTWIIAVRRVDAAHRAAELEPQGCADTRTVGDRIREGEKMIQEYDELTNDTRSDRFGIRAED
jgi:hypothetical protein